MTRSLAFQASEAPLAWLRAETYAGPGGRVATMPDIADARIATLANERRTPAWNSYVTTASAEYVGTSKQGARILIVAHGVGPLARAEDYKKVYRKRGEDRSSARGAISREKFLALESGKYGEVSIVDYDAIFDRYEYPFIESVGADLLSKDPWFKARIGPRWEAFLEAHVKADALFGESEAKVRHIEKSAKFPPLFEMGGPRNEASYGFREWHNNPRRTFEMVNDWLDTGMALAHLLAIGQVTKSHIPEYRPRPVLNTDISVHSDGNGSRFVGMPKGTTADFTEVDGRRILAKHWRDLMVPAEGKPTRLRHLMEYGDGWFAQTMKKGESMDTGVPEHPVKSMREIGAGVFRTKIVGYHGFLRYGISEVEAIAPAEANAYVVGDASIVDDCKYHEVPVTFYKAKIDHSRRLLTTEEIEADADLVVKLAR